MASEHFIERCVCGNVLLQCRCPGPRVERVRVGPCACQVPFGAAHTAPSKPSAAPPPTSWLDRLFGLLDDPSQPWAPVREPIQAARAELADLRRRAEDLELMLRFHARENCEVGPPSEDGHPYWLCVEWGPAADDPEGAGGLFNVFRLELPDDGTGLPLLTAEARAALKGSPAPSPEARP